MSFAVGALGMDTAVKAAKESKRDEKDPFIMFGYDRMLTSIAISIPGLALAVTLFAGNSLFTVDGVELVNPRNEGQPIYNKWTDITVVKAYCWSHLSQVITDDVGKVIDEGHYLFSYSCYPYVLLLIAMAMYSIQVTWRFSSLNKLVSILDYVLDGLEESIRDMMEFILDEKQRPCERSLMNFPMETKEIVIDDAITIPLQELDPLNNGEETAEAAVEEAVEQAVESNLYTRLENYFVDNKMKIKYYRFNKMIQHYSNSTEFKYKFHTRRLYLIILNIISIYVSYALFISPSMSHERINCLLPNEFRTSHKNANGTRIEVNTAVVYFSGLKMRNMIVEVMMLLQLCLILLSLVVWFKFTVRKSTKGSEPHDGMLLLLNLPTTDEKQLNTAQYTDLNLIMDLVIVNKNRLRFLRLALDVLDTTSYNISRENRNTGFLRTLREMALWNSSDDANLNAIVDRINENLK